MNKKFLALILVFSILLSISFISAENLTEESDKIDNAYSCLNEKIDDITCDSLSLEEKIFSALATGKCKEELISQKSNDGCWPSTNCNVKDTALAVLALNNLGEDTTSSEEWLISKEIMPQNMEWFLQIETDEPSTCNIVYDSNTHTISLDEEKKISGNAGSCFEISSNGYWLEISSSNVPDCYGKEFEISCDKDFKTNLLFRSDGSDTLSVYEKMSSASAGGLTVEKVESFCLGSSGSCNYEESLWASLVLHSLEYNTDEYLPYLISMEEKVENEKYLPEAFLYFITADESYSTELLTKQSMDKYWLKSGDKFYDTALALYPFQDREIQEKTNSKEWLLDIQNDDGCWESNIRNTAFLLFSIWPEEFGNNGGGDEEFPNCEDSGYHCLLRTQCSSVGGDILGDYEGCSIGYVCCSEPYLEETCSNLGGTVCLDDEYCDGEERSSSDGTCCLGQCKERDDEPEETECEINGGYCRSYGCNSDEKEANYECDEGKTCCVEKREDNYDYTWLIVLSILVVLTVLAIVFRDKLRRAIFKMKSKFGGGRSSPGYSGRPGPRGPPGAAPQRPRNYPRRIPGKRPLRDYGSQKPKLQSQHELDNVLKKLKDMSK